ncbi:EF-hand domain-containing protein [Seohaeicola saemankumensis]|nr:EF-hand domain-containing protein [Seohaeicola saemankumensis]MCA0872300.1 EF-hand domain-containing protein [Seohaeicola saemankumensis]
MTLLNFAALCALALATASGAATAGGTRPGAHFIENWDLDGDGRVTSAEAAQKRAEVFVMFDQDADGALDAAEYDLFDETRQADMAENAGGHQKGPMQRINQGLQRVFNDTDGDGRVTADEFTARSDAWFAMIDRDGDGVLTPADFRPAKP